MGTKVANPEPLGLSGFAFAIFIFSLYNIGVIPKSMEIVVPVGLFYGGLIQLFASFLEIKTGNTLRLTAFGSYGLVSILLASFLLLAKFNIVAFGSLNRIMDVIFVGWYIFTAILTLIVFKSCNGTLIALFVLLDIFLVLLIVGNYTNSDFTKVFAGYEGVLTAFVAWYGVWEGLKNNNTREENLEIRLDKVS